MTWPVASQCVLTILSCHACSRNNHAWFQVWALTGQIKSPTHSPDSVPESDESSRKVNINIETRVTSSRHYRPCETEMDSSAWTAALLKQPGVRATAGSHWTLCAGDLPASRLAAGKFCVTRYVSIEGHKARPHSSFRAQSPSLLCHLSMGSRSRPARWEKPCSFIFQQPISDSDLSHGTCLNEAVSRKSALLPRQHFV